MGDIVNSAPISKVSFSFQHCSDASHIARGLSKASFHKRRHLCLCIPFACRREGLSGLSCF